MSKRFLLDHLRTFSIGGPDARTFAQSQFTVSVDTLSVDRWSPLAWCDPKGRVLAFMMARSSENGVDLVLPGVQAEDVRLRLERFTIGRRVAVTETEPVAGTFDPDDQAPVLAVDPSRAMLTSQADADPEATRRWQRLDLCLGIPWLQPANSEKHLPQWLGLEQLGALAYDKGCYPGQEVIARLHYRGSIKYRLYGLKADAAAEFAAHARVSDTSGTGIGHWLGGMNVGDETIGLAILSTSVEKGDEVLIHDGGHTQSARVTPPKMLC